MMQHIREGNYIQARIGKWLKLVDTVTVKNKR
jgi:hypothetical protein